MPRPQFSLKSLLWLMAVVGLASLQMPQLWKSLFPPKRTIDFSAAKELDDDWCLVYTLFDDGTYETERVPLSALVPPAAPDPGIAQE
jgi:hypothetical protein